MKNIARTGIALLCLSALTLAGVAHSAERIGAFHADIRIAASGELFITETIEIQASGRTRERGIVRVFPSHSQDRLGRRTRMSVALEKVLRNGRPEPYALERAANGLRLRTEAGRALERGKHVYEIAYRTARQIRFFDAHDELHWNVAAGLQLALERLSAEVHFERPVPAERMKLDASTGAEGAAGQDYHGFVREGSAAFRVTRPLPAREGMRITVAFPKGAVDEPSFIEGGTGYLFENPGVPVGIAVLALMLALLVTCRARFVLGVAARLPRPAIPEGVGPGAVRFIDRGRFDERCLIAALLGLQNRGYLRIRERGERFRLERTGNDVEWFPGEEKLARRLLRDPHDMRRRGRAMDEAGRAFARELKEAFGRRAWTSEGGFVLAAAGIGLAGVLAMLALETPAEAIALLACVKSAVLAVFAVRLVPVYRARARAYQPQIEALRRYIATAEPQDEAEFSQLLPYAVALELENVWGRRFVQKLPANLVGVSARDEDTALARPRRPLRHTRSAAA